MTGAEPTTLAARQLDGVRLDLAIGPLLAPALARTVGALAARADLTLDRLDDAVLVADAISHGATAEAVDDRLPIRVETRPGALTLRIGPLRDGGARRLLDGADDAVPGAQIIQRLASRARVSGGGSRNEYLVVELLQEGTP
ncbi:hypothetical protein [Paraconexibacter algicola]|uniref:Histidine kinase/HSP90-like ATPase domain-containing protein n=1 Tax=Paraconexibacter algicola TaxID=2133960 RepID=A0A2T4UGJ6_9ACTN|nr:hypothetical protein [Paraconexibacter algicola]PTL58325.1 hypothetical protein C7Y72_01000 [Paraconexibacter algicola]